MKALYEPGNSSPPAILCNGCADGIAEWADETAAEGTLPRWAAEGAQIGWPESAEQLMLSTRPPTGCGRCGGLLFDRISLFWSRSAEDLIVFDRVLAPFKSVGLVRDVPPEESNEGAVYDIALIATRQVAEIAAIYKLETWDSRITSTH